MCEVLCGNNFLFGLPFFLNVERNYVSGRGYELRNDYGGMYTFFMGQKACPE